ncbi:DUF2515 family protein [Fervidibacillus halotolerans]|uniref:DUF2515 domain-containing protein n=1 Tax=Fervidibacillus halotolerans TaxID=2980027 RepID=A0A9E8RZU1_9BACI|nr:DUF2515 family protein [Fervidibacillus halotolerans]WAA13728.1 DUF2515 domain-containing protein [Fervidibacillus halotolerans]
MDEQMLIKQIALKTRNGNVDNISRTNFYETFYFQHPEIKWALLAAFVSRNAGWNMCDLNGDVYSKILSSSYAELLFLTYERANWLIFQDAFPQLLVYHYSTIYRRPMFHLLKKFQVSSFMYHEWMRFWITRNEDRLLKALIINEQNVIQKPVIDHPLFRKKIFQSLPFKGQDFLHYSIVILPTLQGELFGASVKKFVKVDERIELGKTIAEILFKPALFPQFLTFVRKTTHTGSRFDFEKFLLGRKCRTTPFLRIAFPVIRHQKPVEQSWDEKGKVQSKWFDPPQMKQPIQITNWYKRKRKEIEIVASIKEWFQLHRKMD